MAKKAWEANAERRFSKLAVASGPVISQKILIKLIAYHGGQGIMWQ